MSVQEPTALYRIYARDGRLLYVGISVQPGVRLTEHRRTARWWPDVDVSRTRLEWLQGRTSAERAERAAICGENPTHNVVRLAPLDESSELVGLGRARQDAKRAYDEATAVLRAGVLRALEAGRAEAEVARAAGVDRMTVRDWAGKRRADR
jgi:hypothetical protein